MEYAYLGLFQRVFEWVLNKIFDPVFRFVSNLLTTVLSWLFEEVLAPILLPVLQEAFTFFVELWKMLYSRQLYLLFTGILKLIDYLEKAFDVFIGLSDVTYTEANGQVISGTLVEVLMQQKAISTAFWALTLGGLGLALLLTIYATAKSAFDLDFENKRPVSKVLAAMMKTFVQFFTVPFFVYFFLKLSAVILKGVTSVLNFGGETTLGRIVFTIASLDAAKQSGYNISDAAAGVSVGVTDSVRAPFYQISGSNLKDYAKMSDVDAVFYIEKFDYLIGFIAAVFLLFTIGVCLIVFVQRIFELCMLYLASPYFVCMIPLDDGEKFSRWREMFIAKCFTGFGSAVGMRLFLMICPMIMGNRIRFGTASSPEMDYMMKLFFLAGGAWAVYKSGPMITSLLSSQAGASEANTAAVAGGMLYAYTAGKLISKGQQGMQALMRPRSGQRQQQAAGGTEGVSPALSGKFNGLSKAGTAGTAWHKPPNKPLPKTPAVWHKAPNKPLPKAPATWHKPPDKPLPNLPAGVSPKLPNKPLSESSAKGAVSGGVKVGRGRSASMPPAPGRLNPGTKAPQAGTFRAAKGTVQNAGAARRGGGVQPGAARTVAAQGTKWQGMGAYGYGYYRSPFGRRPIQGIRYDMNREFKNTTPASAYGTAYGRYWMSLNGSSYVYNRNGAAVSRSFPGSAVRSGADIVRAGYAGINVSGMGSSLSSISDVDSGSASSSGGVSGGTANAQIGKNNVFSPERYKSRAAGVPQYQVAPARMPVTSVQSASVHSYNAPVNYSAISIRGISHGKEQGRQQMTRRNTR